MVFKNINNGLWFYKSHCNYLFNVEMLHSKILGTIEKMWSILKMINNKKRLVQWMVGDNVF
jgi:hypothetical protein